MLLREFKWKEVIHADEPVLVDFWAPWCGPCRSMNPILDSLAKDFKVCKVNVDANQKLAAHYGISSIPALLIFKTAKWSPGMWALRRRRRCVRKCKS